MWGAGFLTSVDSPSTCSPLPPGQDAQGVHRAQASAAERGKQPGGSPLASCRPPPFPPSLDAGQSPAGSGSCAARARLGGAGGAGLAAYLVLIITQSWSVHSGRARRSHRVLSTKSPGKKSEPQASVSSMGAQGSAPRSALSARLRSAPRGSETGAARPPLFLPSTLHPRQASRNSGSRPALAPSLQRHSPRDQAGGSDRRWRAGRGGVSPLPPLGREAPPDSPAGRRATAEASCCPNPGPRRVRTRGFLARRHCARDKRRATVRRRSPNRRAAEAVAGRVEALGTSVLSPRTPPLPSGTSPKDEMPCTCHCLPLLPCPGRRDGVGAEPTEKPGRKMHLVETPYHQCGTSPPGRNTTWCEWCDGHLLGNEGEG